MTTMIVLGLWVVLSLPLGMVVGSFFGHQRRHATRLVDFPVSSPAPSVPLQTRVAA